MTVVVDLVIEMCQVKSHGLDTCDEPSDTYLCHQSEHTIGDLYEHVIADIS